MTMCEAVRVNSKLARPYTIDVAAEGSSSREFNKGPMIQIARLCKLAVFKTADVTTA